MVLWSIDIPFNHLNTAARTLRNRLLINKTPTSPSHFRCIGFVFARLDHSPLPSYCIRRMAVILRRYNRHPRQEKKWNICTQRMGMWLAFYLQIIIFHQYFRLRLALTHSQQQNELIASQTYRQARHRPLRFTSLYLFIQMWCRADWMDAGEWKRCQIAAKVERSLSHRRQDAGNNNREEKRKMRT